MISEKDKKVILDLAKKYKVRRIILFGSASKDKIESRDIDLAVEGISSKLFFKFYGELIFNLSQPVDLVDLSKKNKFSEILTSEGIQIWPILKTK